MTSEVRDDAQRGARPNAAGAMSRDARRQLKRAAAWGLWGLAAIGAVWLAGDLSNVGVSPGAADLVEVPLAAPRQALVQAVHVAPGDEVKEGQLLVSLDPGDVDLELAVAESELLRLRAEVRAEAVSLKEQDLVTEERFVGDAERAAVALAQLEAEGKRDAAELVALDEQIARQERLVQDRLASQEALDELRLRRAALARQVAEHARLVESARAHLTSARRRAAAWRGGAPGTADEDDEPRLSPHHAAVKAQEERVAQLRAHREQLEVRAPIDGQVARVLLSPGGVAPAGAPLVTLVDTAPRRVTVYVDEARVTAVRAGDRAQLVPSDRQGPALGGVVRALGAGIVELPPRFRPIPTEPSFGREVYVVLDDDAPSPLPGQAFDVTFARAPDTHDDTNGEPP